MTNTYNVTEGRKEGKLHERDIVELTLNVPIPREEIYTNSGFVYDDPKLPNQHEVILWFGYMKLVWKVIVSHMQAYFVDIQN